MLSKAQGWNFLGVYLTLYRGCAIEQILIERDIDLDRFITYEEYSQFISALPRLSKNQMYFLTLGVTGWRPCEAVKFSIYDIDREKNRLRYEIAKAKKFMKGNYEVKYQKIKWRAVPEWYMVLLDEYIKRNVFTMAEGFIFSSRDNRFDKHMTVQGFQIELARIRHKLYNENPKKWAWLKEHFQIVKYPNGREQKYYKFSLYSFRKMHTTYFARMLEEKGMGDVIIHTAKHMGHTKVDTTMKYVKSLVDEKRMASNIKKPLDYSLEFALGAPKVDKRQMKLNSF